MSNELTSTPSANSLSASVPVILPHDRLAAVMDKAPQLTQIAADLFASKVEVEVEEDPEIEGRRYVVFSVETKEGITEVANRRREWFRLTGALLGIDEELVHLFVIFRQ
jgi:hypothetical protein